VRSVGAWHQRGLFFLIEGTIQPRWHDGTCEAIVVTRSALLVWGYSMTRFIWALSLVFGVAAIDANAQARSYAVSNIAACNTVTTLPNGGYVYKNSAPLRAGGSGTPLVGYRREPTLLMKKREASGSASIFDSQGTKIGSCPLTSAHGFAGGRFRCTMQTTSLRRRAVQNTGSPQIFFLVNARKKICVSVPESGRCYGSSKGLCNQVLK
jgi:hypothetical protein